MLGKRGSHVLGCGPAYARSVAEYSLGLALDLARGPPVRAGPPGPDGSGAWGTAIPMPDRALQDVGLAPCDLNELLTSSKVVFVLATVTAESQHLLAQEQLAMMPEGARLVIVSRASVVDCSSLLDRAEAGQLTAAVDVRPEEPVPADARARQLEGLVLSAHRAGGTPTAFTEIGWMVLDDLVLIARGLPPVRVHQAAREVVGRYQNRPVT